MRVAAIINPQSGGGRTIKVWREHGERLTRKVGGIEVHFSERAHHATELAREVATQDFDRLIVVGGDGTLHEVVNGLFDRQKPLFKRGFSVGVLNGGRGCDYVKSLPLGDSIASMLEAVSGHRTMPVDVGCVQLPGKSAQGSVRELYYMNSATYGLGGDVAKTLQKGSAFLPPTASYLFATVKTVARAAARPMVVTLDGQKMYEGPAHNLFVCNGRYSGGGMLWAPTGRLDDGKFDVLLVRDLSRAKLLSLAPYLYSGTISKVDGITAWTASEVQVESPQVNALELDGETYQASRAAFQMLPRSLEICVN